MALKAYLDLKKLNFLICLYRRAFKFLCTAELSMVFYNIGTKARGDKTFFMLNSVEREILNAHKYKNIKKFSIFQTQISRECYFS